MKRKRLSTMPPRPRPARPSRRGPTPINPHRQRDLTVAPASRPCAIAPAKPKKMLRCRSMHGRDGLATLDVQPQLVHAAEGDAFPPADLLLRQPKVREP